MSIRYWVEVVKFGAETIYDRAIRNEEHFWVAYEYIKYNAVNANLSDDKERFYGRWE